MCAYRKVRRVNSGQRRPVRRQSDSYYDESEYPEQHQHQRRPAHSRNYRMQPKSNNTAIIVISIVVAVVLILGAVFVLSNEDKNVNNNDIMYDDKNISNEHPKDQQSNIVKNPVENIDRTYNNNKPEFNQNDNNVGKTYKTNNDSKHAQLIIGVWTTDFFPSGYGFDLKCVTEYKDDKSFIAKFIDEDGLITGTFLGNWEIRRGTLIRDQHTVIIGDDISKEISHQEHKIISLTKDALIIEDISGIRSDQRRTDSSAMETKEVEKKEQIPKRKSVLDAMKILYDNGIIDRVSIAEGLEYFKKQRNQGTPIFSTPTGEFVSIEYIKSILGNYTRTKDIDDTWKLVFYEFPNGIIEIEFATWIKKDGSLFSSAHYILIKRYKK